VTDAAALILAWVAGLGLGALFFGGLWWTLRKAVAAGTPAVWFVLSLLVRMSLALSGFYLVSGGDWQRLLLCLLGFVMSRAVVTWLTRPSDGGNRPAAEARHAA